MAVLYDQETLTSILPDQTVELSSLMEVEFLRGSAWYKAFLVDYETDSQQAVITFGGQMNRDQQVPLKFLRYPPSPSSSPITLQEKGPVEALAPAAEGEPEGWWKGKIAKMKGEFYVVEFDSQGALFTDIFEGSKVRSPNSNQPFSETNFSIYRTAIEVPLDLHSFCSKDVHGSFSRSIGALSVSYRRDQNLLVFLAKSQGVIQRANLLSDMHMRNLRTKMNLEQRASEVDRTNPSTGPAPSYMGISREATFRVEPELLGLAIGRQGTNVTNARSLGGILRIDLDEETCTFHIIGESDQAIEEARKRLEFIDLTIDVPRKSIGRLIGKKGSLIQEIVDKSGVVKVKIEGDDTTQPRNQLSPDDKVPFHFIGRKENVETAQIMMDYQMAHIRDLDKFISEHDDMPTPLINSRPAPRGPNPPSYQREEEHGGYRGPGYGGGYRGGDRDDRYYSGNQRRDREPREPREQRENREPREPRDTRETREPREPRESRPRTEEKKDEDNPSNVHVQDRPVNRRNDSRPSGRQYQSSAGYRDQGSGGRSGERRRQSGRANDFGYDGGYDNDRRRPFRENRGGDYPERRDRGDRPDRVDRDRDRGDKGPYVRDRGEYNRDTDDRRGERSERGERGARRGGRGGRREGGQRRYNGGREGRANKDGETQETADPETSPPAEASEESGWPNTGPAEEPTEPAAEQPSDSVENGDNAEDKINWSVGEDDQSGDNSSTDPNPLKIVSQADLVNGTEQISLENTEDSTEPN